MTTGGGYRAFRVFADIQIDIKFGPKPNEYTVLIPFKATGELSDISKIESAAEKAKEPTPKPLARTAPLFDDRPSFCPASFCYLGIPFEAKYCAWAYSTSSVKPQGKSGEEWFAYFGGFVFFDDRMNYVQTNALGPCDSFGWQDCALNPGLLQGISFYRPHLLFKLEHGGVGRGEEKAHGQHRTKVPERGGEAADGLPSRIRAASSARVPGASTLARPSEVGTREQFEDLKMRWTAPTQPTSLGEFECAGLRLRHLSALDTLSPEEKQDLLPGIPFTHPFFGAKCQLDGAQAANLLQAIQQQLQETVEIAKWLGIQVADVNLRIQVLGLHPSSPLVPLGVRRGTVIYRVCGKEMTSLARLLRFKDRLFVGQNVYLLHGQLTAHSKRMDFFQCPEASDAELGFRLQRATVSLAKHVPKPAIKLAPVLSLPQVISLFFF
eukprot:TRINITY_DN8771_c0_g3_i2.p1 TRINITY_DN8771_c0_g3~~TRINITY_DN8771_c0_g3_i2.p1  ORF type:complete len:445 (-),score=64.33 TRINITY_DN8771_c0_g3_i2:44-1354(-)